LPPSLTMMHQYPEADIAEILKRKREKQRAKITPINYWQPQDKQETLLKACGLFNALSGGPIEYPVAEKIGYGGAAFGGKTEGLIGIGLIACMLIPGVKIGYFRRKITELEGSDGPIDRSQGLYIKAGGQYNNSKHVWKFPNGSTLRFAHCHHESDVYAYQSQAFDILLIDEATHFSWFIIDYLLTRNRTSKDSTILQPFSVYCSNPGNVGHLWYMQLFDVERQLGDHLTVKKTNNPNGTQEEIYFIPAFLEDNPIGIEKDPTYEQRLMSRDPQVAKALRYGDWSVFAGQVFREFSKQKHTCKPFEIPGGWVKWRAIDWGYAAPWAVYWFAKNPDNGRVYVYREIYQVGRTDPEQAKLINEYSLPGESYTFTFADPSMWTKRTTEEIATSTFDAYLKHGIYLTKADNSNETKKRKVHSVMGNNFMGDPILQIFETCTNLIRTIPALVYDEKNPELIKDGQEDHAYDAFAYGLTNWEEPRPPEKAQKVSGRLDDIKGMI